MTAPSSYQEISPLLELESIATSTFATSLVLCGPTFAPPETIAEVQNRALKMRI